MKPFPFFKPVPGVLSGVLLAAALSAAAADRALDDPGFKRAVAAYSEGRLDEAQLAFEQLAQRFPDDPNVLNNLAVIAAKQNDTGRAIGLFKRAIETDAAINVGYQNLSAIYAHLASLSYRDALSLESAEPQPLQLRLIKAPPPSAQPGAQPDAAEIDGAAAQAARTKEVGEPLVRDPEAPVLSDRDRDVVSAVRRWAQAWSRQDPDAYFASYVGDYTPPGDSHRDWKRQRRERVTAPRHIEVKLSDVRVRMRGETDARVTFLQKYRSNLLSSSVIKRLQIKKVGDEWKITSEQVL